VCILDQQFRHLTRSNQMKRALSSLTVLLVALSSPAFAAGANSADPTQAAKEFVRHGTVEYSKQHWDAARADFLKAWELKQHYAIAANLGDVEMKLGLYRDAAEHWKYALANLPAEHAEKRADAEASLKECRSHLSAVRLAVSVAGAAVTLDGHEVPPEALSDELLVEPGPHKLEAQKAGYLVSAHEFTASAGESREVGLDLVPEPPPSDRAAVHPSTGTAPAAPTPDEGSAHSSARVWVLVGGGAATVSAAGVGTYFSLHQSSLASDGKQLQTELDQDSPTLAASNSECAPMASMRPAACDKLAQNLSARTSASNAATVSWVAAGALGAATIVTYLLWPAQNDAPSQGKVALAPWLVGAKGGSMSVEF